MVPREGDVDEGKEKLEKREVRRKRAGGKMRASRVCGTYMNCVRWVCKEG